MKNAILLLTAACLAIAVCVQAKTLQEDSDCRVLSTEAFYGHSAEGWYWYQDPAEQEEGPQEVPAPVPAQQESTLKPLSAEWVRTMMPRYQDAMWSNPTPENVQAYMLLQRFAVDRSQKVASVAQQVVLGNPLLDESFRRPLASAPLKAVDQEAHARTLSVLGKLSKRAGFYFFFGSSCRFCRLQAPILKELEHLGFRVLAVSMDGKPIPGFAFDNTVRDQGQADWLHVESTPALFLVSPGDAVVETITQGFASMPDLIERVLVASQKNGWITEAEFNSTRPIIHPETQRNLSSELPALLQAASGNPSVLFGGTSKDFLPESIAEKSKQGEALMDGSGWIDPGRFVSLFANTERTVPPKEASGE